MLIVCDSSQTESRDINATGDGKGSQQLQVLRHINLKSGLSSQLESRYVGTLEGGRAVELILRCVTSLPFHTTGRVLVPRDDVDEHALHAKTTVTLTDKARHSEVGWPDSVEAHLVEPLELSSADDVHPVGVRTVLQQSGYRTVVFVIDTNTERGNGGVI